MKFEVRAGSVEVSASDVPAWLVAGALVLSSVALVLAVRA